MGKGMEETTIIYYTSNREHPLFEKRIQEKLLENCCGLPIVSVSQKPIKLGKNICVGDVGASGFNCFRQIQIACKAAKTRFVISAEADCCYPPEYFTFIPPRDDICYRNSNLYVMGDHRNHWFYKPRGATHAQVINREYYLKILEREFKGAPKWSVKEFNFPKERRRRSDIFKPGEVKHYHSKNPVFQIKTHRGLRYYTASERIPVYELPYWGKAKTIRKYFMKGVDEVYVSKKPSRWNKK